MRAVKVFSFLTFLACCMNEVTLGWHLGGWGWLPGKPTLVIRGWELSAPPLISGEEKSLEVVLIITGQSTNQSCNEVSIRTQKAGVGEGSQAGRTGGGFGWAVTQSVEAQHPFLTSPVHSFHLAAPEFCPFMANWSSSAIGKKEKEKRLHYQE